MPLTGIRRWLGLCGGVCLLAGTVQAQDVPTGEAGARLGTVVVTGTRTERLLEDVPVRTEVIDAETLDRRHARDLADALRLLPGVYLRTTHGKEGQEVWMQGLDGDRVLVLIDGIPAIASTGSTVDLTQISVADVERIEVVKGATSALYGSSAMGGVINIITRRPGKGTRYRLQGEAGAYDGRGGEGDAPHGGHLLGRWSRGGERLSTEFTADWRRDDGYSLDPDRFTQDLHAIEHLNLSARLDWRASERTTFSLRPTWMEEDKSQRMTVQLPGGQEGRRIKYETVSQPGVVAVMEHDAGTLGSGQVNLSWSEFDNETLERNVAGALLTRREALIETRRLEGQWNTWWGETHHITLGALARDERLSQDKDDDPEIVPGARHRNQEFFLQDNVFIGEHLELLPGVRYQHDSDFGDFVAPSLNVMRWLERESGRLNLRAGLGRGYRVPNLKERYYEFDQSQHGYKVVGNPDLEAESSVSLQLGAQWLPHAERAPALDVNLFYNRIRDLITTEFNPERSAAEGMQVFDYQNLDRARTWGVETGLSWSPSPDWHWAIGYTWLQAEDENTGLTLSRRPEHQIKTEIAYTPGPFQFSVGAEYQSPEYLDSSNEVRSPEWTRVQLRAAWRKGMFTWLFGVDNLFDQVPEAGDHEDLSPKRGRYIYAGLRIDGPGASPKP